MLQLFKNNQLFTAIGVFIYSLPLFVSSWLWPSTPADWNIEAAGALIRPVYPLLQNQLWLAQVLLYLLVLGLAMGLNAFVNNYRLGRRPTYIPAICFLLAAAAFPKTLTLSPTMIANLPLLIVLNNIYRAYERKSSILEIFNAGFWLSVAILIYTPAIWYLVFLFFAWNQLRSHNPKELLIILIGLLIPFFLMGTVQFIGESLYAWWQSDLLAPWGGMQLVFELRLDILLPLSWWLVVLLWSLVNFQTLKVKTTIREQKYLNVIFGAFIVSLLTVIGVAELGQMQMALLTMPLAVILALNLQSLKNKSMSELIHLFLYLAVLFAQFYGHLNFLQTE